MFSTERIGILLNCYVLRLLCGYRIPKQLEPLAIGLTEQKHRTTVGSCVPGHRKHPVHSKLLVVMVS